jgi:hypothetical protein
MLPAGQLHNSLTISSVSTDSSIKQQNMHTQYSLAVHPSSSKQPPPPPGLPPRQLSHPATGQAAASRCHVPKVPSVP